MLLLVICKDSFVIEHCLQLSVSNPDDSEVVVYQFTVNDEVGALSRALQAFTVSFIGSMNWLSCNLLIDLPAHLQTL